MPDIWLPGYARVPLGSDVRGKPYQYTANPKGCLHTTEGGSIAGARSAYSPYPPHLIYDWRTRQGEQHIPLNLASYAAMDSNDDDFMVQVELVGFASETRNWSDTALRNIALDVIAPLEKAFGIPRRAIYKGFKDERDGIVLASASSPNRISAGELRDFSGWLGHQHLPAPDSHWDPGALPLARIFTFLSTTEDDMATFTEEEKQLLLNGARKVTTNYKVTDLPARPLAVGVEDDSVGHLLSLRARIEEFIASQRIQGSALAALSLAEKDRDDADKARDEAILTILRGLSTGDVDVSELAAKLADELPPGISTQDIVNAFRQVAGKITFGQIPTGG